MADARRLVEHGVPIVSVNWHDDGHAFWDTHGNNFNRLKNDLIPPADQALALSRKQIALVRQRAERRADRERATRLRYPSERAQPGRALGIAEVASARAARLGKSMVNESALAEVVADAAGVPLAQLLRNDDERFANLETRLQERVVGHADARGRIAAALRRSYAGFRGQRPLASCLLLGPTGVGKTETARAIADALFDGESALVRIDLSEYSEPHAVARLIGSPRAMWATRAAGS